METCHFGPDRLNRTRNIKTRYVGSAGRRRIFALPLQYIGTGDAGGFHPYEHLTGRYLRNGSFDQAQGLGAARMRDFDGEHGIAVS